MFITTNADTAWACSSVGRALLKKQMVSLDRFSRKPLKRCSGATSEVTSEVAPLHLFNGLREKRSKLTICFFSRALPTELHAHAVSAFVVMNIHDDSQ